MLNKLIDRELFPSLELDIEKSSQTTKIHLSVLTNQERNCYELQKNDLLSMQKIADKLDISKGTVQTYLNRAKKNLDV